MKPAWFRFAPMIAVIVMVASCTQQAEEAGEHSEEIARGQDFEISTTSEEARIDFDEGMYLADVGRNQEANEKFEAAIEKDPAFAYAYLWVAYTAASGEEFAANINRAMENIEWASEGERLMIESGRTFIDNDAEKRLQLAEQLVELYPHSPRAWLSRSAA